MAQWLYHGVHAAECEEFDNRKVRAEDERLAIREPMEKGLRVEENRSMRRRLAAVAGTGCTYKEAIALFDGARWFPRRGQNHKGESSTFGLMRGKRIAADTQAFAAARSSILAPLCVLLQAHRRMGTEIEERSFTTLYNLTHDSLGPTCSRTYLLDHDSVSRYTKKYMVDTPSDITYWSATPARDMRGDERLLNELRRRLDGAAGPRNSEGPVCA